MCCWRTSAPASSSVLGFDIHRFHALNPRLVYASIKGFGSYGPYRDYKSYEPIPGHGRAMSVTGSPDGPHLCLPSIGDSGTPGILRDRHSRRPHAAPCAGEGQQSRWSMQDAVVNLMRVSLRTSALRPHHGRTGSARAGVPGPRSAAIRAGRTTTSSSSRSSRCGPAATRHRPRGPHRDARYETPEAAGSRADVDALVEAWTITRAKHGVMEILAGAGVPCGACLDTAEVLADPHCWPGR